MELKLVCDCGQKFKFEVEPVNGELPLSINCPSCGTDATVKANAALTQTSVLATTPTVAAAPRLQIIREAAPSVAVAMPPPPVAAPARISPAPPPMRIPVTTTPTKGEFNLGLGILGAFLGAGLGVALMYGFYALAGFRFPLLGVGIGALTGYGAKLLFKGTDSVLGYISGTIALIAVVGTLFLIYGEFPIVSIISVIISVSVAWRISS
jgi:hypothetical protein